MTPQERRMVDELFERLASLENTPRDAEALRAISDGLQRAPNALYPLVQSVLVQDEALKRADARIRELEDELGIAPEQPRGFLDSMRDNLSGQREPQGSVPSVRPSVTAPVSGAWRTTQVPPAEGPPPQNPGPSGGSFLGTAAASAAGAIGGVLLMNSMRGLFGGQHGQAQAAFDPAGKPGSSWGPSAGSSDLARQAGIGDIGRGGGAAGPAADDSSQRAGLFDTAQDDVDDSSLDDDLGLDDAGDTE
jgi:hypothetical protein